MFYVKYTKQFKRDLNRAEARKKQIFKLEKIMKAIEEGKTLPIKMHDHFLSGGELGSS